MRAVTYARISSDKNGDGAGVERQEHDCRALCEANGWTIAEVSVESDVSASARSRMPRLVSRVAGLGLVAVARTASHG
jgi:DNA invertase Pin-like site-specific DNA recombinase